MSESDGKGDNESGAALEGQLRESFGRVVYSHKTHEKCADILQTRLAWMKTGQIALSAVTTAGLIATLADTGSAGVVTATVASALLLFLNAYMKNYDLGEMAQKHRQTGSKLWFIRESYLSLLTDMHVVNVNADEIRAHRDTLLADLNSVYMAAPSTTSRAYKKAQKALKYEEDMTFSDKEIDAFLPDELHRT